MWQVPAVATALYLAGVAVHELTHVAAVWLLGCRLDEVRIYPPSVGYTAPDRARFNGVRLAPIVAFPFLCLFYAAYLLGNPLSYRLLGLAALVGYFPRSGTDWAPVANALKALAVQR